MWVLPCVLCMFSFPEPTPADRAAIQELIPGLSSERIEDVDRPWSEVTGPHLAGRIQLLTLDFGIVRVARTWHAGSIEMQESGGIVLVVTKRDGVWRLNAKMER